VRDEEDRLKLRRVKVESVKSDLLVKMEEIRLEREALGKAK